jgi:hypothetical protein
MSEADPIGPSANELTVGVPPDILARTIPVLPRPQGTGLAATAGATALPGVLGVRSSWRAAALQPTESASEEREDG